MKFICKMFNRIVFFNKDIEYYTKISREIFDIESYYENFNIQLQIFFDKIKKNYTDTTNLFLKFSFDELKNCFLISNVLFHMFNCSRSDFAKDNCSLCCRLYIDELFQPVNFNIKIDFDFFSTELKDYFYKNRYSKTNINLFYDSLKHIESINSDKHRCLKVLVINNVCELIILFFETQIRIFYNFFFELSTDVFFTKCEKKKFLSDCIDFILNFLKYCLKNIKISMFEKIFSNYDYSSFPIKIINNKYKEFVKKKYAKILYQQT